ncbi:GNAT family N-acetyltransferase [Carboxylicivirga caseinilyticus]|uniref:GNAT family N-acetyltransferase n=1 Tax=Carboxylicivirga caseinilyticus TaxID=3417572 RepID=UPI003D33A5C7|nr:GNAT family N-acetyltransferase [Marinilabiliaceae bacterium A049]
MNHNVLNRDNLQSFYNRALSLKERFVNYQEICFPGDNLHAWPQFIYGFSEDTFRVEERLMQVLEKVEFPAYVIIDSEHKEVLDSLRSLGFMPVEIWPMMYLNISDFNKDLQENMLTDYDSQILALINETHFAKQPLEEEYFKYLLGLEGCMVFGMYDADKVVAACLTFKQDSNLGIYMMSTNNNYRGKGWGRKLLHNIISDCKTKQIQSLTLQANQLSVGFYKKIGFSITGNYLIFVKK